jgi:hypothetical protein
MLAALIYNMNGGTVIVTVPPAGGPWARGRKPELWKLLKAVRDYLEAKSSV